MVEFSSYEPGTPCWVDLTTPDVDGAKTFYSEVFGWDAEDAFDDDGNRVYTSFVRDGRQVAGLALMPPEMAGMPPVWNTYVAVVDVTATAEKVTAAGGAVLMPPTEMMSAGSMAVFADPTGAAFSVWKAGDHRGAEVCNEAGTWAWNELLNRDLDTAQAFYSQVFGWTYDPQDMGPMGEYHVIEGGDNGGLGGMMTMPAEMPAQVPNHWIVYFMVADADATVKAVTENGGRVVQGPTPTPGVGVIANIHDPSGGSFAILQPQD